MAAIFFWLAIGFILYTYLGYPLALWLVTRSIKRPEYPENYYPSVTLMIPAYNEAMVIERKIENSLDLTYPHERLQILVAADGSDDGTVQIVRKYFGAEVDLSFTPVRGGKMAAINRAMGQCRGEIVVFSDANNFYAPNTIVKLVAPFQDHSVGTTTGAKLIIEEDRSLSASEGLYWRYESRIKEYETLLGSCISSVGEILAVRRELFQPAPADTINDDRFMVLDILKRGYKNIYVPEARSLEYVSPTAEDEIIRRKRISVGAFQVIFNSGNSLPFNRPLEVWKILSHKYFRSLIPLAMVLALLTNFWLVVFPVGSSSSSLLWVGNPFNWIFLLGQMLFYLVGILGNWINLSGKIGKAIYLPTFLLNSNMALLSGLFTYFNQADGHLWERVSRTDLPEEEKDELAG